MRSWLAPFVIVVATAAACSSGDATVPETAAEPEATIESQESTPRPTPIEAPDNPTPTSEQTSDAELVAVMDDWWATWAMTRSEAEPDFSELEAMAAEQPLERIEAQVRGERGSGFIVTSDIVFYPDRVESDGDDAEVEGCVAFTDTGTLIDQPDAQPIVMNVSERYVAGLTRVDDGWRIERLDVVAAARPCVPAELEAELSAVYERYWTERLDYLDPPDPVSPLIDELTTGEQRTLERELAQRLAADGEVLRGRPETHPEVIRLGAKVARVSDCQLQDEAFGIYDASDERTDLLPPIEAGQRDMIETTLLREEGTWRVATTDRRTAVQCEFFGHFDS